MTNAFDKRPFAISDFMQTYWVETGALRRVAKIAAARQLERNYYITGLNAQPHIEDLLTELYIIVHETLMGSPDKFPTMLDAKKYAVRLIKTRIANLVVPMMEHATIPKNNKSIARALGKKVTGDEVVKDKDGNWMDSEKYQLDPTHQEFLAGAIRKPIMEQIDWNKHDNRDGDDWFYPDLDRPDLEYNFRDEIPMSFSEGEQEYLFNAMSYDGGLRSYVREEPVKRTNADILTDELYESRLYAIAMQPNVIGHNGGPALDDDDDNLVDLVAERIGPLMGDLSPLEQKALIEVAKYLTFDESLTEKENWVWYQAGKSLGKSDVHMRKIKEKIAAKARKNGLPN